MNTPWVVQLDQVSCQFRSVAGPVTALDRVSLTIGRGEFVAVMGATGSGKSTLLNCAAGLEAPTCGTAELLGQSIGSMSERALSRLRRERVGFVFQAYNLLTELTVEQNVMLPVRLGARPEVDLTVILGAVGLSGFEARPVGVLSGGQRQRVAVARALICGPAVVFADEPTGALDPSTGRQILALLRQAVGEVGATVVLVTHDPTAAAVSDRLVMLRDGRVVADADTPDAGTIARWLDRVAGAGSHEVA